MSVNSISSSESHSYGASTTAFPFKTGDIFSASVVSKTDERTILKLDNDFIFETTEPIQGNVGDNVKFEVICGDRNKLAFKQVMDNIHKKHDEEIENAVDLDPAILALRGKSFAMAKALMEARVEDQNKVAAAIAKMQKQIENSVSSGQSPALSSLLSQGVSMNKITLDILSQLIGSHPDSTKSSVSSEELTKAIDEISANATKENTDAILAKVTVLMNEKVLLTKRNLDTIDTVEKKVDKIMSHNNKNNMLVALLRQNMPPTVENFYRCMYGGEKDMLQQYSENSWNKIEKSVTDFLTRIGLAVDKENLAASRFLIANDLTVNENNIDVFKKCADMTESVDKNELFQYAAQKIKKRSNEVDIPLFKSNPNEYNTEDLMLEYREIIKDLPKINDNTIKAVKDSHKPMTLGNLRLELSGLLHPNTSEPASSYEPVETYRRNIFEISYRLSTEAALRLSASGVRIDNMPLGRSIEMLKQTQELINKDNLAFAGARATQENLDTLNEIVDKVRSIAPTPATLGMLINKSMPFSINSVYYSDKKSMASKAYDSCLTRINARFGDSFQKVSSQVSGFLKNLDIEQSTENIRAASALVKNNMDITSDSIMNARLISDKIDYVTNKLHPFVAARMVRDGFNPLNADIDDVINYMKSFEKELGEASKEKVSRYIYELDKKLEYSADERKSVISIYRMLSAIDKTDGWVTGFAAKNNLPLTLESLMEASKYYKNAKNPITLFNNESEKTLQTKAHVDNLLEKITDNANPETVRKAIKEGDISKMHLERSHELLSKINEENNYQYSQQRETPDTSFLKDVTAAVPAYLQAGRVLASLSNMKTFAGFTKNEFELGKNIEKLENAVKNKKTLSSVMDPSLKKLKDAESPSGFLEEMLKDLDGFESDDDEKITEIQSLKELIENSASLQQKLLNSGSNFYKVPVRINGQVSTMNFYILNEQAASKDKITIALSLNTKNIGNITCKIELLKNSANLDIQCEDGISAAYLNYNKAVLNSIAETAGITIERVTFSDREYVNPFTEYVLPQSQKEIAEKEHVKEASSLVDIIA